MVSACGSSSSSSSSSSDQTITMNIAENTSASLTSFAVSTADADCDPRDENTRSEWAHASCISPNNYTVGISKIELLNCDSGSCSESDGSVSETSAVTLFDVSSTESSGRAIDLANGATLSGDDIETIDAGTYGGLRFTITFLKQTLDNDDLNIDGDFADIVGADSDLTYMVCTKNGGCQDDDGEAIENSEAGDIMANINGTWYWMDQDVEDGSPLTATRPSNPVQDEGFSNLDSDEGGGPQGDPDEGFVTEMQNDAGSITIADTGTYTLTSTFVIGYAYSFDDTNDDGLFDPTNDAEGYPDRPKEINFTASE